MSQSTLDLIYDWNEVERRGRLIRKGVTFFDETLRDGLQNPSVTDPPVEAKIEILHLMNDVGIHAANIELPGSPMFAAWMPTSFMRWRISIFASTGGSVTLGFC